MDGKWEFVSGSGQYHANFPKAKRHCSLADNCFGVGIGGNSREAYSINFPIWFQEGGNWYVYKKESVSGNFIYQECVLVINPYNTF